MFTCQTQSVSCVPRCNEKTAGAHVMINALLQTSVNSRNILMTWILRGWCLRPTLLMTKITLSRRNLSPPSSPTPSVLDTCRVCSFIFIFSKFYYVVIHISHFEMNCWILPWSFRVTSPLCSPGAALVGDREEEETSEWAVYLPHTESRCILNKLLAGQQHLNPI